MCLKKFRRHWYLLDSENAGPLNLDQTPLSLGWYQVQGHTYTLTPTVPHRQLSRLDPHRNEWGQRGTVDLTNDSPLEENMEDPPPPTGQPYHSPSHLPPPPPLPLSRPWSCPGPLLRTVGQTLSPPRLNEGNLSPSPRAPWTNSSPAPPRPPQQRRP